MKTPNLNQSYYDSVGPFHEGFARVKLKGKYGLIDQQRNEVVPPKYDQVESIFHEGFARVIIKDKWNLVDKQGKEQF
jgi:hypothetical protein